MEEKKLIEYVEKNVWEFFFRGFDEIDDFYDIGRIIEEKIVPDKMRCIYPTYLNDGGGYFVKDGIRVELENDMAGNNLLYKETFWSKAHERVRAWAQLIWDELVRLESLKNENITPNE